MIGLAFNWMYSIFSCWEIQVGARSQSLLMLGFLELFNLFEIILMETETDNLTATCVSWTMSRCLPRRPSNLVTHWELLIGYHKMNILILYYICTAKQAPEIQRSCGTLLSRNLLQQYILKAMSIPINVLHMCMQMQTCSYALH